MKRVRPECRSGEKSTERTVMGVLTGSAQSRCGGKEMEGRRVTRRTIWVDGGHIS